MINLNIKWIASLTLATALLTQTAQAACVPADCASLGYTQAASECKEMIKCPFDTNKVKCLVKVSKCAVGDLFYKSGKCSTAEDLTDVIIGVVGWVDSTGTSGLVVAPEEAEKTWSNEEYDLPCIANSSTPQTMMNGKESTTCIVQTKNKRSATYEAGVYCANYTYKNVEGWFLPSSGEAYKTLFQNKEKINDTLDTIGKTIIGNKAYWTSTEYYDDIGRVWFADPYKGSLYGTASKTGTLRTRCLLAF